ncbi:hypothetical protein [Myroides injenensis]|uniref:hypothetical protein n=1 Tax=Myroides injenensis TaxID=1183151 RepID=UPI00028A372D|nr:hypothetical protein [Myroides injenensis]
MNTNQLKEKAELFLRNTQLFVRATNKENIIAYINEEQNIPFIVQYANEWMALKEKSEGEYIFEKVAINDFDLDDYIGLSTKEVNVYPPLENLLHFGDIEIQQWLLDEGIDRNSLFDLQEVVNDKYISLWMDSHPMYKGEEIYAFSGGWAMIWPEDDEPMQWNDELEFLYQVGIANEPYIEIYFNKNSKEFICIERNT